MNFCDLLRHVFSMPRPTKTHAILKEQLTMNPLQKLRNSSVIKMLDQLSKYFDASLPDHTRIGLRSYWDDAGNVGVIINESIDGQYTLGHLRHYKEAFKEQNIVPLPWDKMHNDLKKEGYWKVKIVGDGPEDEHLAGMEYEIVYMFFNGRWLMHRFGIKSVDYSKAVFYDKVM